MRSADVNGFTIGEPASRPLRPGAVRPDLPYWPSSSAARSRSPFGRGLALHEGVALTMPSGRDTQCPVRSGRRPDRDRRVQGRRSGLHFDRLRRLRGLGLLARRLVGASRLGCGRALPPRESRSSSSRQRRGRSARPSAPWLRDAEELLPPARSECVRLGEVARELGVPAVRIARAFRERHGVSVGEYGRRADRVGEPRKSWGATGRSPRSRPSGVRGSEPLHAAVRRYLGRHPAGSGRSKAARRSRQGAAGVRSWGLRLEGGTMRAVDASAIALLLASGHGGRGRASWRR